jgi:hypothetical protein
MEDRAHYLTLFRRLLWHQQHKGPHHPLVVELYRDVGAAMRRVDGVDDFIREMLPRLAPDGSWLPGLEPGAEAFAPAPRPTNLRQERAPALGATCKFCGARMRKDEENLAWRCEADPWHSFWINRGLPPERCGVWMGRTRTDPRCGPGPVPDWAARHLNTPLKKGA